jgi:hypothetical protein
MTTLTQKLLTANRKMIMCKQRVRLYNLYLTWETGYDDRRFVRKKIGTANILLQRAINELEIARQRFVQERY